MAEPNPILDQAISKAVDEVMKIARNSLIIAVNDPALANTVMSTILESGRVYSKNDEDWISVLSKALSAVAIRMVMDETLLTNSGEVDE